MSGTRGADLAAALAGDQDAFGRITAAHRRELHVHCYRLLGSFDEAVASMADAKS